MINNINILAIDDESKQLEVIQNAFFNCGVPCLPIQYKYELGENNSGIDHIDLENYQPRVVVSDLNLRNGSLGNPMDLVTPIYRLLEKLAIKGPYMLVFWSGVTEEVEKVMELLQERFHNQVTLPISYCTISKNTYLNEKPELLKEKVAQLIAQSPLLNAILDWESRIVESAKQTTNSLFDLTKPDSLDPTIGYQSQHTSEMQKVLAKIGNETVGVLNAKESPELALDLGLAPVLNDQLNTISSITNRDFWSSAVPSIGEKLDLQPTLSTKLNTFYHIEKVESEYPKSCRGVFLKLNIPSSENKDKIEKINARLGLSLQDIINEEFLLNLGKEAQNSKFVDGTQLGFIEISAECDQAQKKTKLHRYVLAALTPLEREVNNKSVKLYGKNKKAHNGIYRVPNINIDGTDYILQLSFKYQIGAIPSDNQWLGEPLFRLRDQIMVDIAFNCAQYIARPGIIEFR